jgi:ABC-type multidrug transport system ATPase subunit
MDVRERATGVRIDARGVGQVAARGRRILRDVSLTIRPGELVAIIGASGAGKTTLLEALSGVRPAVQGTVRVDGAERAPGLPADAGYVPQEDIVHRELPLGLTLRYAARLRLSAGTPPAEAHARVDAVLADLRLADRADTPVGLLSGGERKRASIAVELLTRPRVLFLDEPTSGLDPATAEDFMSTLRGLADIGSTVVFTTHNPPDVEMCDRVVALAPGGALAFTGAPADARAYFGTATIAEIYARLDGASPVTAEPDPAPAPASDPPPTGPPRVGAAAQWWRLTRRSMAILRRNRLTLAILLGSPVAILAMFVALFRPGAFDAAHPSPSATVMTVFWIAFGGFFFGLTYGLLQICTEFAVVRREALAGVRPTAYLLSKVAVLLPLLAAIDAALLGVLRALDRLPALGPADLAATYLTLLLSSACALALGLLCSAAVADPAQATLLLPMLCFPQVLFVGAILPVPLMATPGQWLSVAMSNRWAFEGLGHSLGLPSLWRDGASPLGPPLLSSYGASFDRAAWVDWVILGGFTLAFAVATVAVLARRCTPRAPRAR